MIAVSTNINSHLHYRWCPAAAYADTHRISRTRKSGKFPVRLVQALQPTTYFPDSTRVMDVPLLFVPQQNMYRILSAVREAQDTVAARGGDTHNGIDVCMGCALYRLRII